MAEITAVSFFDKSGIRIDPQDPKNLWNDKFLLSKGHCAPILCNFLAELPLLLITFFQWEI